jgi:hypothetical protein
MNQQVSKPVLIGALVLVVALCALISYNSFHDKGGTNIPVPGPIKQTEGMAANPRPGATIGSRGKSSAGQ